MKSALQILKNPWTILASIAIGVLLGVVAKDFSKLLDPFGKMYLYFLQMCVIPILISAIISSLGNLIKTQHARKSLKKMTVVFLAGLFSISAIGTLAGVIGQPGHLDKKSQAKLGSVVNASQYAPDLEISLSEAPKEKKKAGISDFLLNMIPNNIFKSLSTGRALELVFFSIIFGVALGFIRGPASETLLSLTTTLFETFQKVINWAMYGLSFALICLLSAQIASVGVEILNVMLKFILLFYAAGFLIMILNILVIWKRSGTSLKNALKALQEPIIISLATRSSFASIPSAIQSLENKMNFEKVSTNLFIPLGTTICRYGNILFFALGSLFVVQLYGASLGAMDYFMIIVGCVFAGIATTGASGILTLPMLAIVLEPLGLPIEAVLIIFIAIDPIIDPMRTMLIVLSNIAATSFITPKPQAVEAKI